jgi:hypothetical protein
MRAQAQITNAVTVVDGFDTAIADPTASPFRGPSWRFKDGDYVERSENIDVDGKTYAVFDRADGWQKLQKGNPAEYLMQRPGEGRTFLRKTGHLTSTASQSTRGDGHVSFSCLMPRPARSRRSLRTRRVAK